ncbi:unnamed protein product [Lactuca saligna]|uniref:Uncharacterized protein n=1 Tax=Lactuca saligna TaxID=75948 RepID=A0AA36E3H8_LACSI|nr:unnamed protein product [Lactuca saligna]
MVIRANPNESVSDLRDKYFAEWFEDRVEERFESPLTVTRVEPLCLASTINTYEQIYDEENDRMEEEVKEVEDFEDGGDENKFYYSEEEFEDEDDGDEC